MIRRVKKLYSHRKKNKAEKDRKTIPKVEFFDQDGNLVKNENEIGKSTPLDLTEFEQINTEKAITIPEQKSHKFSSKSSLFKKIKTKCKHENCDATNDVNSMSKSTGDLLSFNNKMERRHSTPQVFSETSSRSSCSSLETLRENRRSVICKLDVYINHVKKSVDEENIAYAPNRLCCAQLLRMVYLRREQQCQFELLHPHHKRSTPSRNRSKSHLFQSSKSSTHLSPYPNRQASSIGSLQDFRDVSFDSNSSPSPRTSVWWHVGSCSEVSSVSSSEYNLNNKDGAGNSDSDTENLNGNSLSYGSNMAPSLDSNYNLDNTQSNPNLISNGNLSKISKRKSIPLFPQAIDVDIY